MVVIFVYMGMHSLLLVSVSLNYKKANLEGVAKRVIGNKGKYFVLVMLIFAQMSCFIGANLFICRSINFYLIIGEFLKHLFCLNMKTTLCYKKNEYLLFSFIFSLFIILIPNLKKFQHISTISGIIIMTLGNKFF